MNVATPCLTAQQIHELRFDQLSPEEMSRIEEHVGGCPRCQSLLDNSAADAHEWGDLRESLVQESVTDDAPKSRSESEEEASDSTSLDQILKMLGPTDDPRMLGRIGAYEIVGVLGQGGMGVVFKGYEPSLNRYVAIKLLLPHLAMTGAARKRFAREAQAAAAVVDDHVMAIHGVAEWQGVPYLVMPFTRGVTLQKRLIEQGPFELREILRIGMQAAAGLAAAHAQGLVHRDVKPANMLLAEGVERVTLVDFGLARTIDDASITRTGFLAGTPQYMSPEQVRSEPVDARSDLFSLGSVLYAICTGRAPFRSETSYGVLRLITDSEPTPIRELNPDVPDWLCQIVERLMAKQPAERYASATEVSQLLGGCLAHVQQPQSVALPAGVTNRLPPPRNSKSRFVTRAIALSALLSSFLLGMFLWFGADPPDIAGTWSGAEWGEVTLTATKPGEYQGRYATTHNQQPGEVRIAWSRLERRFNGAWSEGADCHGDVSFRLVDQELRGSYTTDASSKIEPGLKPRLGDIRCVRVERTEPEEKVDVQEILRRLEGRWELIPGQIPAGTEVPHAWEYEFRDDVLTERRDGEIVSPSMKMEDFDLSKWPVTYALRDIPDGPSRARQGVEFPDDGRLWIYKPDTRVRRGDGKTPMRVWIYRRSGAGASPQDPVIDSNAAATPAETKVSRTVSKSEVDAVLRQFEGRWEMEPGQDPPDTKIPTWGEFAFREGLMSQIKQGKVVSQGTLEIDTSKSPPTFLMQALDFEPSFIRGTFEFPSENELWLSLPDTRVRPRAHGRIPMRVWMFRRISAGEVREEGGTNSKPSSELLIRNADGSAPLFNDVVEAHVGYPHHGLPQWVQSPDREGSISLAKLSNGPHWLLAAGNSEQRTLFQVTIPTFQKRLVSLRAAREWTKRNIEIKPSVVIDERDPGSGETILVEIRNNEQVALEASEQDLQLRTGIGEKQRDLVIVLSPEFPHSSTKITIEPGATATLRLKWQDWLKRGFWVMRTGEIAEQGFPPAEPGRMWVRVGIGNAGFSLVSVAAPKTPRIRFLADYSELADLSFETTEEQLRNLAFIHGFKFGHQPAEPTGPNQEKSKYLIEMKDGYTVLVTFINDKCGSIQRIHNGHPPAIAEIDWAEYQRFEGTWRVIERIGGRNLPMMGQFDMDESFAIQGRQMRDAEIRLNSYITPRQINVRLTQGADKGKVLRGLYQWVDEALPDRVRTLVQMSICTQLSEFYDSDRLRPQNFEANSDVVIMAWEKVATPNPPRQKRHVGPISNDGPSSSNTGLPGGGGPPGGGFNPSARSGPAREESDRASPSEQPGK